MSRFCPRLILYSILLDIARSKTINSDLHFGCIFLHKCMNFVRKDEPVSVSAPNAYQYPHFNFRRKDGKNSIHDNRRSESVGVYVHHGAKNGTRFKYSYAFIHWSHSIDKKCGNTTNCETRRVSLKSGDKSTFNYAVCIAEFGLILKMLHSHMQKCVNIHENWIILHQKC